MYIWEDSFSQRVTLTRGGKAPQPFHRAPRARVACVRVLISVDFVLHKVAGSRLILILVSVAGSHSLFRSRQEPESRCWIVPESSFQILGDDHRVAACRLLIFAGRQSSGGGGPSEAASEAASGGGHIQGF